MKSKRVTRPERSLTAWAGLLLISVLSVATARAADTQPPTAPTNLNVGATSATTMNLVWTGSSDNVGVTAYLIERCKGSGCTGFSQIGTSATATYSDSGLIGSTVYVYRVRATDAAGNLSGYSNTFSQITLVPDTQAPTMPTNFTGKAVASFQVNLSWSPSSDNVGVAGYYVFRCQGASCSNFTLVVTVSGGTTYSDTGRTASTVYRYYVNAFDAAGNLSLPTVQIAVTTPVPDTQAPTIPGSFSATAVSTSQVNLSWAASSDNLGVGGYRLERCAGSTCTAFVQVATPGATNYSDLGLASTTTYRYRIRAVDVTGNLSGYSAIVSATTRTPDTQAPTAPTSLAAVAASSTNVNLTWTASTDNVGVAGYRVERCAGSSCTTFVQIGAPAANSFSDNGLTASTSYRYRARAIDAAGNLSSYSNIAGVTTLVAPDTQAPTVPTGLAAAAASTTQVNLTWAASTDNVGVTGYRVERCTGAGCTTFAQISTPTTTSYGDTGLTASTSYLYRVRATDAAGNLSGYSAVVSATTQTPDTQAPTAPASLTATVASGTQITLAWTASTDNVGVTGYRVERCSGASCTTFAQVAAPTAISYSDAGLTSATSYSYRVRATDAAGNLSAYSVSATAVTPDTVPPSAPAGMIATPTSSTQITLAWTASTDNVGVTAYLVERCQGAGCSTFAPIISVMAGTSFNDSGLAAGTSYSYRIRAQDAAANVSVYSSVVSAVTTADTTPPTVPGTLTATAASTTQMSLVWGASTDNVGVSAYFIERCQGVGCAAFVQVATSAATTFSDTGLTVNASYTYRVRATDVSGNSSGYSNTATAATTPTSSTYTYDTNGKLQTVTTSTGSTIHYTYDAAGNLTGVQTTP